MKRSAYNQVRGGGSLSRKSSHRKSMIIAIMGIALILQSIALYKSTDSQGAPNSNRKREVIALHIQNDSGEYELSSGNAFPTTGYVLNTEKTSCVNGGTITQNPTTKTLSLSVANTDSCNVYFDKEKVSAEPTLQALKLTSSGTVDNFDRIAPYPSKYAIKPNETVRNYTPTTTKYYTYSSSYTFDEATGAFVLDDPKVCRYSSCYSTLKGKYVRSYTGSTSSTVETDSLTGLYKIESSTTSSKMYYTYISREITGYEYLDKIFEMEDDYGTSYYFRGQGNNNYVKFGKWNESASNTYIGYNNSDGTGGFHEYATAQECSSASSYNKLCTAFSRAGKDMWWRIVRVNGDGSLRMIYDGTQAYTIEDTTADRFIRNNVIFNPSTAIKSDTKYVGYMFSPADASDGTIVASTSKEEAQTNSESSVMKKLLDSWYKENIVDTGYSSYVSDEIFCNDRSIPGKDVTGDSNDTGLGYGGNRTHFGAYVRMKSSLNKVGLEPSFKCPQKNDAFTVDDTSKGNGALTYPVGLITADEIIAAGAGNDEEFGVKGYYLRKNNSYWTMTPKSSTGTSAWLYYVFSGGPLYDAIVANNHAVAPVINLSAEYVKTFIGDGSDTNPFRAPDVGV